jgi:hypothetical protein
LLSDPKRSPWYANHDEHVHLSVINFYCELSIITPKPSIP